MAFGGLVYTGDIQVSGMYQPIYRVYTAPVARKWPQAWGGLPHPGQPSPQPHAPGPARPGHAGCMGGQLPLVKCQAHHPHQLAKAN